MGLSNQEIKTIKGYQQKKNREEENVFVAETPKIIEMLLSSNLSLISLYALDHYAAFLNNKYPNITNSIVVISEKELARISGLNTPQSVIGIWENPSYKLNTEDSFCGISLILDGIQDPGNLGTIVRVADWFGIDRIICSLETANAFQPKCVQSSMGAIAYIPIYYTSIPELATLAPRQFPIFGTFLEGSNMFSSKLESTNAWYIIGNEAHGISEKLSLLVNKKLNIPKLSSQTDPSRPHGSESLNAAVATGILCAQIAANKTV